MATCNTGIVLFVRCHNTQLSFCQAVAYVVLAHVCHIGSTLLELTGAYVVYSYAQMSSFELNLT